MCKKPAGNTLDTLGAALFRLFFLCFFGNGGKGALREGSRLKAELRVERGGIDCRYSQIKLVPPAGRGRGHRSAMALPEKAA